MRTKTIRIPETLERMVEYLGLPFSEVVREGVILYLERRLGRDWFVRLHEEVRKTLIYEELKQSWRTISSKTKIKEERDALFKEEIARIAKKYKVDEGYVRNVIIEFKQKKEYE